jgi:tetratricopeptide (TPR) repeat protein
MRSLYIFLMTLALLACNVNESGSENVLSQPPYANLTDSLSHTPGRADLYYKRGVLLFQNDQLAFAKQDFQKAWQISPREEYALSMVTLLKKSSSDSAISFLEIATRKLPQSIALQVGLARGYQNKGELDKALDVTNNIINRYPGQLDALNIKSEILASKNDKKGSLASLEKAYSIAPSDPSVAYDLAYAYADIKEPKAIELSDSLIKAKTDETEKAWYIKGVYYANTGNAFKALKSFDNAIKLNYNFLDAYRDKGQLLMNEKRYKEALQTYSLALKIAPASADFYFLLGKTQQVMGNINEAKLNYLRAYGLDKTLSEAKEAAEKL